MKQSPLNATRGIGMKDKLGYAFGDLASCLVFGLTQSVLNKYYTDVLQLSVLHVMIMTIIARIWDAVNDPIWGWIIDRAPRKADGRYRRWIRIFSLPVALAAVLMFLDVRGLVPAGRLAFIYVTYILFGMIYTCINIPYGSLAQVITSDDKERSSLSVFRSIGSTFGALPAMVLASICYVGTGVLGEDGKEITQMSYSRVFIGVCVIAVLAVVFYLLCHAWTKERVVSEPAPKAKGETGKVIRSLLKSRPFMAVSLASMLFLAAQMFGQGYNTYLFHHLFTKPGLTMVPTVFQYLPVAVIMFFATKLGNKFGRREVCSAGVLLAAVFYIILFLLSLAGLTDAALKTMYNYSVMIPAVLFLLVFLLLWFVYPLSKKKVEELQVEKAKLLG